ncbi:MAG: hypothetical protein QNJ16_01375 [Rhodobacter sp.]|nr:hypothetical protein [Rhodobacter sp.]
MSEFLPKEVRDGLEAARKRDLETKTRLQVRVGGEVYPLLRFWQGGFALDAETAPRLRGFVDLYHAGAHLYQCLIVASSEGSGDMVYEFKRSTAAVDRAPLDFVRDEAAPVALISK